MEYAVSERVKHSTIRWYGHIERMPGSSIIEGT